jgi:hypothetical protein
VILECKYCGDISEVDDDWELDIDKVIKYGRKHFCGHGKTKLTIINVVTTEDKLRVIFAGQK